MKLSVAVVASCAASAAAFAPPAPVERISASLLAMDRRTAAALAAGLATGARAGEAYGRRIAALEPAVDAGDFAAVAAEKNAFVLYNSGAIAVGRVRAEAVAQTNAIFAAIRAGDAVALRMAYGGYRASQGIAPSVAKKDNATDCTCGQCLLL